MFTESPVDETPGRDVTVSVTADMSEHDIGKMLKEEGLVEDANLFYAQLKLSAYSGKLKPLPKLKIMASGQSFTVVPSRTTSSATTFNLAGILPT